MIETKKLYGKIGYGYTRVSSQEQEKGTSLDDQEKLLKQFVHKHKIKLDKIYTEKASAMKTGKRPMFNELVKNLENGCADIVIFTYIDRMARNFTDAEIILRLIEEEGLIAVFLRENLILKAPLSPIETSQLYSILGYSNYQGRLTKEKCKAGIKYRSKSGFRPNRAPYGYCNAKRQNKALVMKSRAKFVQKAFELYNTGYYSIKEVALKLHQLGYKYEWQPSKIIPTQSLTSMLKNVFYTGRYRVKQDGTYVDGNHIPIITKELFESVQKRLSLNPKAPRKHKLQYSQLITCSTCGHYMTGDVKVKPNGKKYIYYRCTNPKCSDRHHCKESVINSEVESYLREIRLGLIPENMVKDVLKNELLDLKKELALLKRNVSRKYDMERRHTEFIESNDIDNATYIKNGFDEINEKYGDLEAKIQSKQQLIGLIETKCNDVFQKRLSEVFSDFDSKTQRSILELITNNFKCNNNEIKITFKSPFRKIRKR